MILLSIESIISEIISIKIESKSKYKRNRCLEKVIKHTVIILKSFILSFEFTIITQNFELIYQNICINSSTNLYSSKARTVSNFAVSLMFDAFRFFLTFLITLNVTILLINLRLGKGNLYGKSPHVFYCTKILLVPTIASLWFYTADRHDPLVSSFLIGSWCGDVFLLSSKILFTILGGFSFALGHISMILFFNVHLSFLTLYSILLTLPTVFLFSRLIPQIKFEYAKDYGALVYCFILQFAFAASAARSCIYPIYHPSFLLCYLGYFFFLISDYYLIKKELKITSEPKRVEIIGCYALSEIMIIAGTVYAL